MILAAWGVRVRRAGADDRALAWVLAAGTLSAVAVAPALPALARYAPPCVFHALTGVPCPGCGSTRAVLAFFRGDFAAALAFNPLVATALAAGLLAGALAPVWVALGGPLPALAPVLPARTRVVIAAAIALNWAYLVWRGV